MTKDKTEAPKKSKKSAGQKAKFVVKALAFICLVILATYGLRNMFTAMQDTINYVLTGGIVGGLVYIIFEDHIK